jgi:hypothetical protein
MGYLHIDNLYKRQDIMLFRECYALEKVHGTSAHLQFDPSTSVITWFSGGEKHDRFVQLFQPTNDLQAKFLALGLPPDKKIVVYGEAYGGSQQAQSHRYGKELKFIAFDVLIGENWQDVPNAHQICEGLGIEFVPYTKIPTDLASLDAERDKPSEVAVRRGITEPIGREGVVLRPPVEVKFNNGSRVICKHKQSWASETATERKVVDPAKQQVLADAQAVADEWVTYTRLEHVLDKLPGHCMEKMRDIIAAMTEDVLREGKGEIVESDAVKKAIGKKTAVMYKDYLRIQLEKSVAVAG